MKTKVSKKRVSKSIIRPALKTAGNIKKSLAASEKFKK